MKIDSLRQATTQLVNQEAQSKVDREPAPQTGQEAQAAVKGDTVSLSNRSRLVAKAQEIVEQTPDVRTEKVEDIKSRLTAGTYNVSGRVVADSMLKKGFNEVI